MTRRLTPTRRLAALLLALALVLAVAPAQAYPRPGAVERLSLAPDGSEPVRQVLRPRISADAGVVVYATEDRDLLPGKSTTHNDVYVLDRGSRDLRRVTVGASGEESNDLSGSHGIDDAGEVVVFASRASNLVAGDTNLQWDVFTHDLATGVTDRVSVSSSGAQGNGSSNVPEISGNGRYVVFESLASSLVPDDRNGERDVFWHDRETGETRRVSVASDGTEANGPSSGVAVSADGRYVAFDSRATNLVEGGLEVPELPRLPQSEPPPPLPTQLYVHDTMTGATERVSVDDDGVAGDASSRGPALSADGRYVAFLSEATNLVPNDHNGTTDIFVRDRVRGTTERVSVASDGSEGAGDSRFAAMTRDGRYVAFHSDAKLVDGVQGAGRQVFLHDRWAGVTEEVSSTYDGRGADGTSIFAELSADARYVAFNSNAHNLVPGVTNNVWDAFLRDRGPDFGVGGLTLGEHADGVRARGWATFPAAVVSSAEKEPDGLLAEAGVELTGAVVAVRPSGAARRLRPVVAQRPARPPGPRGRLHLRPHRPRCPARGAGQPCARGGRARAHRRHRPLPLPDLLVLPHAGPGRRHRHDGAGHPHPRVLRCPRRRAGEPPHGHGCVGRHRDRHRRGAVRARPPGAARRSHRRAHRGPGGRTGGRCR